MNMLPRTLEPEVMDGDHDADEYNNINHQQVNEAFAVDFLKLPNLGNDCLDLGTGTALIPIEICKRSDSIRIMALDASVSMLELARYQLELAGIIDRIQLAHGDVKRLVFEDEYFDAVVSNSLVHHLPEPDGFFREAWRVLRPGGWLFVRDLCRPSEANEVERLVELHAAGETDFSKQLLRQSLHAALTLDEIRDLLGPFGIPESAIQTTSDRHWTVAVKKPHTSS